MMAWERGLQAFQQGRLHEAADRLRDASLDHECSVTLDTRFKTLCYLGASQYAIGRYQEAVTAFEEATQFCLMSVPPADLRVNLANAYLAAGQPEAARRVLRMAIGEVPGNLEAQMLLQRLDRHLLAEPPSGAMLGENPEAALRYLQTLSFSRTPDGGLEPKQVELVIAQIGRYLSLLTDQIRTRDEEIARLRTELAWVRQQLLVAGGTQEDDTPELTPLQILFQKKP